MASEQDVDRALNFRRAQEDEVHLKKRYKKACEKADSSGKLDLLKTFKNFIEQKKTVCINMKAEVLLNLLLDEKIGYINIHNSIDAGAVTNYDSAKYQKRRWIDEFLFGETHYKKFLHGSLNVGNCGLVSYGECCVVLNSGHVSDRTSLDFSREVLEDLALQTTEKLRKERRGECARA